MKSLILLALLGACVATWVPGKEYRYHYGGRIATGIPEINSQYSGAGLKADLVLQVKDDTTIIGQFENVEAGSVNEFIKPEKLAEELPIHYGTPKFLEHLEAPFKLHLNATQHTWIDSASVPSDEPAWVTDIKKAAINLLRVDTFHTTDQTRHHDKDAHYDMDKHPHLAYSRIEETIYGICTVKYTILPFDSVSEAKVKLDLPVFHEFESERLVNKGHKTTSKTNKGGHKGHKSTSGKTEKYTDAVGEKLWYVRKNVDFDHCDHSIILTSLHPFNMRNAKPGSSQLKNIMSRTAMSTYVMSGNSPSCLRVEYVMNEGVTTLSPFGYHTETLMAYTNQTMYLEKVQSIQNTITPSSSLVDIDTWQSDKNMMIVDQDDVKLVTGESAEHFHGAQDIPYHYTSDELKNVAMKELNFVVDELKTLNIDLVKAHTTGHYTILYGIIAKMHKDQVKNFYTTVMSETCTMKKDLAIDIIKNVGTPAAVEILLEEIEAGHFDHRRMTTIFMALPHTLKIPTTQTLNKILSVIEKISMDEFSLAKTNGLINFARLVHNACVDKTRQYFMYPTEVIDHTFCTEQYLDNILSYYTEGLETADAPWKQVVWIQALSNFGSPKVFEIVEKYLTGEATEEIMVRQTALWSVFGDKVPEEYYPEVIDFLTPIVENWNEPAEIRMGAIACITMMNPGSDWYQRLALSTWREPNHQVATYIYSLIKFLSMADNPELHEVTLVCRHILPMTKHADSVMFTMSYTAYLNQYVHRTSSAFEVWTSVLRNRHSNIPREIFSAIVINAGGYKFDLIDVGEMSQGVETIFENVFKGIKKFTQKNAMNANVHDVAAREANKIFDEIKDLLNPVIREKLPLQYFLYVSLMEDMQFLFPFHDMGANNPFLENLKSMMQQVMSNGLHVSRAKALFPIDSQIVFPSAIGLPILANSQMPVIISHDGDIKFSHAQNNAKVTLKSNVKYTQELITNLKVLVPFVEKYVETGVQNIQTVNSPFDFEFGYDLANKEVFFNAKAQKNEKLHFMSGENRPYTVRYPMKPTKPVAEEDDYKKILLKDQIFQDNFEVINNDIIHAELHVKGNKPIVPAKLYKVIPQLLMNPAFVPLASISPVSRYWSYDLIVDPTKTPCKGIHTKFTFVKTDKNEKETEDFSQMSQSSGNMDYSQMSQSGDVDYLQEVDTINYKSTDSVSQRQTNMQSHQSLIIKDMKRGRARSLSFSATCEDNTDRRWDAVLTWAQDKVSSSRKFHAAFLRTPSTGTDNKVALCINGQIMYPRLSKLDTLTEATKMSLKTNVKADVVVGESCNVEPIIKIKGFVDVTDEWKQKVVKEEKVAECLEWESSDNHQQFAEHETRLEKQCQILKPHVTLYDNLDIAFTWNNVPDKIYNFTLRADHLIKSLAYPIMSLDRLHVTNKDNMMHVVANRCHYSNLWNMHITKPTENIVVNRLPMLRFNGASQGKYISYAAEKKKNFCDITSTNIKTFDDVTFPFHNSKCWKVAAKDCSGHDEGAILVAEKNGHPVVKMVSAKRGYIYEIHNNQLKINGQVIETVGKGFKDVENVYHAEWSKGAISVTSAGNVMIMLRRDNIVISAGNWRHDQMCGLCGDMNKEFWADLVGPKKCIYTDAEMFTAAWTLFDLDCAHPNEQVNSRKVKDFQNDCPKFNYVNLYNVYREFEHQKTCSHF